MAEDLVGRTLGRYKITALVGKGGMATVYKATHPGLGQTVAIKVLHPHMATDPDMLGRFRQEARAVANLRHPNIVRVVDFDVVGDQYFMVMEFVDGPTLATQLAQFSQEGRRMPSAETVRIMEPLCSAVDYAHTLGMIHRDIKPANVLLTPQGEPVLTDYGIAKMVGVTQHTATGTVMGSAYYMSPEQAQGSGIDGRTDIYSLGVVLFEILTGRVPYEGDTLATVLVKHITAPVPAVSAYNDQLPPLIDDVMRVALAKDPGERFQTGQALAVALRQGLGAPAAAGGARPAPDTFVERPPAVAPAHERTQVETPVAAGRGLGTESLAARTARRDVFISYAAADKETADAVCASLEGEGVSCWIGPRDVLPGRSFAQSLASAIHAARVCVLVFSAATNQSHQVERELDMVVESGLPIVQLRVEAVRPSESFEYYLAGQHWLAAYPPPLTRHLGRLAEAVSLLLAQAPAPAAGVTEPGAPTASRPGPAPAAAPATGAVAPATPAATAAAPPVAPEPTTIERGAPAAPVAAAAAAVAGGVPEPTTVEPAVRGGAAATTLEPAAPAEPTPERGATTLEPAAQAAPEPVGPVQPKPAAPAEPTPEPGDTTLEPAAPAATTLEPAAPVEAEAAAAAPTAEAETAAAAPTAEAAAAGHAPAPPSVGEPRPEVAPPAAAAAASPPAAAVTETRVAPAAPAASAVPAAEAAKTAAATAEPVTGDEPRPAATPAAVDVPPAAAAATAAAATAAAAGPSTTAPPAQPTIPEPRPPAPQPEPTVLTPKKAAAPPPVAEPAPTTYEAPAAGATVLERGASAAAAGAAAPAHAAAAPVPSLAAQAPSSREVPRAGLRRSALFVAAGVGVAWVVILFVVERLLG